MKNKNLGESEIKNILGWYKPPYVFLENAKPQTKAKSMLFKDFETVLTFRASDDIEKFFGLLEEYRNKGFWLAGYFTYEFGYFLEPSFQPLRFLYEFPLAWIGVSRKPLYIKSKGKEASLEDLHYHIQNSRPGSSEDGYLHNIARIKEELKEGNSYQVNLTFKEKFDFSGEAIDFYFALRRVQPTDYCAYIHTGEEKVVSLSPELFFQIHKGIITARPMKGTAERGIDDEEDKLKKEAFQKDSKVRAENLMIVDLLRNDLGRICSKVWVKDMFSVEKYATLYQMTSTVEGKIKKAFTIKEIFTALFPCGSVTGAPKIKTMQLIAELEDAPRGVYTGAIGYIAPNNEACFNVAIRTAQIKGSNGELGIGGGIVYDSDAQAEYQEARLKGRFLTRHYPHFDQLETILWEKKKGYYLLEGHLARLEKSCNYFSRPVQVKLIKKGLQKIAKRFTAEKMVVRILITPHCDVKFEARTFKPLSDTVYAMLNEHRVDSNNLFLYHKTTCRYWYDEALHKAKKAGLDEVIFLNDRGEVTEGSFSNIFVEKDGVLFTPPVRCGLLPGVLRAQLLQENKVKEKILYPGDLETADKIFIGNSVRGLVRVKLKKP